MQSAISIQTFITLYNFCCLAQGEGKGGEENEQNCLSEPYTPIIIYYAHPFNIKYYST